MSRDIYIIVVIDPACLTREYAKTSKENVDKITVLFQADPQKIKLLFILDNQIELLAKERRPDLSCFFDSFELHSIAWSEEGPATFLSLTRAARPCRSAPRQIRPVSSRRLSPIWTG